MQLGMFTLADRIGSGRLAQVYRASDPSGRQVAVKLLAPEAELDDVAARQRFAREIQALEQVRHPNIIELLGHGFDDELGPYLITPLIEGHTLRALLARGPVIPEIALLIVHEIATGVAALHKAGIVHRDLKPENVMIRSDGSVVVLDLGLAYHSAQTRLTEEGAVAGSVPYMAPEQIDSETMGPTTDVWALGVILYECLVGERPFSRTRRGEEVAKILSGQYTPASSHSAQVDEAHDALVSTCLRTAPAERFVDATALASAIATQFDWFVAKSLGAQVRMALQNPADYTETVSTERAHRLAQQAETELGAGRVFVATRLLERALAYRPADPQLEALVERALSTPAQTPRSPVPYLVIAAVVAAAIALIVWMSSTGDAPTSKQARTGDEPDEQVVPTIDASVTQPTVDAHVATTTPDATPSTPDATPSSPTRLVKKAVDPVRKTMRRRPTPTRKRKRRVATGRGTSKPDVAPSPKTDNATDVPAQPVDPTTTTAKPKTGSTSKPSPNKPKSREELARLACQSSYLRPYSAVNQFAGWAREFRRKQQYAKIATGREQTYALRDAKYYRERGLKFLWTWKKVVAGKKRLLDRQAPRLRRMTLCTWYQAKLSVDRGTAILRREGVLQK